MRYGGLDLEDLDFVDYFNSIKFDDVKEDFYNKAKALRERNIEPILQVMFDYGRYKANIGLTPNPFDIEIQAQKAAELLKTVNDRKSRLGR